MSDLNRHAEIARLVAALANEDRTQSPAQFPIDRAEASDAGLYSWWADAHALSSLGRVLGEELQPLIYVGQAGATKWPSGKKSAATLGSRIGSQHIRGNARSSTFRLTISSLLRETQALEVKGGRLEPASNSRISHWISEHLRVAIVAFPDRDTLGVIEEGVVAAIDPPLNLDHCAPSPVRAQLRTLRAVMRTNQPVPPGPTS
jgi:hypothetical protein